MKKLIHLEVDNRGTLHCDVCSFDKPCGPFGSHLIGTPCPHCGANMLTARDYQASVKMFAMINWINKWFGWLGSEPNDPRLKAFSVRHHAGETIIREENNRG